MFHTPLLLALGLAAGVPQDGSSQPDASGLGWAGTRLDLDVRVLPAEGRLELSGTILLTLDKESSTGPSLAISGEVGGRFLSVEGPEGAQVELNRPHPLRPDVHLAVVRFDEPQKRGATVKLSFTSECDGRASQFVVDKEVALASWVTVWHPVPMPDPNSRERFASTLSIPGTTRFHLPDGWTSFSNGSRVERIDAEGPVTELWRLDEPVARSFAAGPYSIGAHEVDGRSFTVCLLSRDPAEAQVQARSLARAIEAMEARFGPYPYPSYGIVEVPESKVGFYGSSEQGFLMAASSAFEYGTNLPLFAHEASHGWWGNLIGNHGPGGILLSESLAQYGAVIAIETIEGEEAAIEFLRFSRRGYNPHQCAKGYFGIWRDGNDKALIQLKSGGWDHQLSDSKGNWLYHMLRYRVGDEVFFATMRGLIETYGNAALSVEDLKQAFLLAAPKRKLERFFEQWLERKGAPALEVDWEELGIGIEGTLRQVQEGEPYHLFVELVVVTEDGRATHVVETTGKDTPFELPVDVQPLDVEIDPWHRILRWTEDYGERPGASER